MTDSYDLFTVLMHEDLIQGHIDTSEQIKKEIIQNIKFLSEWYKLFFLHAQQINGLHVYFNFSNKKFVETYTGYLNLEEIRDFILFLQAIIT